MTAPILERLGERKLGFIGVAMAAALGLFVAAISVVPFGEASYSAELAHTAGLRVGEDVQIAGIAVGEVRDVSLDGQHVLVKFTADRDVRLGQATTASVKVGTLLGNHYLELAPAGSGTLPNGRISLTHTSVPFNLQDVIEGSSKTLGQLDGKTVSDSLTVIADAMDYSPEKTRAAIDGVARLSQVAAQQSDRMRALLDSSKDVTGLLASNSDELIDLMKQSTVVIDELMKRRTVIHRMLRDANRLAVSVTRVLDDNRADLDPLMRDFTAAVDNLRHQEANITASVDGLATVSHYLANAAGNGPYLDLHVPVALGDNLSCAAGC